MGQLKDSFLLLSVTALPRAYLWLSHGCIREPPRLLLQSVQDDQEPLLAGRIAHGGNARQEATHLGRGRETLQV